MTWEYWLRTSSNDLGAKKCLEYIQVDNPEVTLEDVILQIELILAKENNYKKHVDNLHAKVNKLCQEEGFDSVEVLLQDVTRSMLVTDYFKRKLEN